MSEPRITVTLKYSCRECALPRTDLVVPAREPGVDVKEWMDTTVRLVASDHFRRSPLCRAKTITELLIPANEYIGGATKQ